MWIFLFWGHEVVSLISLLSVNTSFLEYSSVFKVNVSELSLIIFLATVHAKINAWKIFLIPLPDLLLCTQQGHISTVFTCTPCISFEEIRRLGHLSWVPWWNLTWWGISVRCPVAFDEKLPRSVRWNCPEKCLLKPLWQETSLFPFCFRTAGLSHFHSRVNCHDCLAIVA